MNGIDSADRLRRILAIYQASPDSRVILDATDGEVREQDSLTLGDLREIARTIGVQ